MSLIMPGDFWILVASIAVIGLFISNKLKFIAYSGLIVTTLIILNNYSAYRAILHIILTVVVVLILRIAVNKLASQKVTIDE